MNYTPKPGASITAYVAVHNEDNYTVGLTKHIEFGYETVDLANEVKETAIAALIKKLKVLRENT